MAMTSADSSLLQSLLKTLPMARRSPKFITDASGMMTALHAQPNTPLFQPGDPAEYLYLLGSGRVIHSLSQTGQAWFQKDIVPGEFFGQHALLTGRYQSRAVTSSAATVFRMSVADLRLLLTMYPALQDYLLGDRRAIRLRSIPLFESMPEPDIRWLAQLVQEQRWPANRVVPVQRRSGLWIIDQGQVEVDGPAAMPAKRLTAGNFFFALQPGMHFGGNCAASRARTVLDTNLFFLTQEQFYRLLNAFPEIRWHIMAPLDIGDHLARAPLFQQGGITRDHLRNLAEYCAWTFVPANQDITTQDAPGDSFFQIARGAALVSAEDEQGRRRPVNLLRTYDSFGEDSLLRGSQREATVRAVSGEGRPGEPLVNGAEILNLERHDVLYAFAERPDLWRSGLPLYDNTVRLADARPRFSWLDPGETVTWNGRRHTFWLLGPLMPLLLFLVLLLVLIVIFAGVIGPLLWLTVLAWLLLTVATVGIAVLNWYLEEYVITSRRLVRHDRIPLVRNRRIEAPLDSVQDVTTSSHLLGKLFDYGDVAVRTASKEGEIRFRGVPAPDTVKNLVQRGRGSAQAAGRGTRRETLRRGLMADLGIALPVGDPDSMRALGTGVRPPARVSGLGGLWRRLGLPPNLFGSLNQSRPAWYESMLAVLPASLRSRLDPIDAPPPPRQTGERIWHKHWANFLMRAGLPLVLLLTWLLLGLAALIGPAPFGISASYLWLVWLLVLPFLAGWLWWEATDYWNDVYVVTDDRIMDLEQKPLSLSSRRRESGLDRVQTVFSRQEGFLANLLNYGDVIVRTAADDEGFTFNFVGDPKTVQKVVFQRLDAFRRRQEERRAEDRRREMVESLQVYHDLQRDKGTTI